MALKELFAITLGEASVIVLGALFILVVLFSPGGLVEAVGKVARLLTRLSRSTQRI